jgi:hypothetical protein
MAGRPHGSRGKPQRCDLQTLWMAHDLLSGEEALNFGKAISLLKEFASTSLPELRFLLTPADRSTFAKRLRRLARRYPRKCDVAAAMTESAPEPELSITGDLLASLDEGALLPVPEVPAAETCSGTELWN